MPLKRFRVAGPFTAYDTKPGALTPPLDPDDPLVQINITAGFIYDSGEKPLDPRMTCPICAEQGSKKPSRLSADEVSAHYAEKHAGFAVPAFTPDSEEE